MSRSEDDGRGRVPKPFSLDSISDRFASALSFEGNKPDTNEFTDLGSPVSPLRTRGCAVAATSSSSSSSGSRCCKAPSNAIDPAVKSVGGARLSRSGELPGSNYGSPNQRPGHRRSGSDQMIYTGGAVNSGGGSSSSASSSAENVLPAGNICPSGKIAKMGTMSRSTAKGDVLGSGTGNYGHGSIMRGGASGVGKPSGSGEPDVAGYLRARSVDPEEVTKAGNEHYKKGLFAEALRFYNQAIDMCPGNAACRNNRAAALAELGRLGEAVKECEEAIRLHPGYVKANHRLACLHLRLGQVELAQKNLFLVGQKPDISEMQKLQTVERHLNRCANARLIKDWKGVLREVDAAIAVGADSSSNITAMRAEALLQLHHLEEADSTLAKAFQLMAQSPTSFQTKFLGMLSFAYIYFVQAQVEMALGRFENALLTAEKSQQIDSHNVEVSTMWNNVKCVARARKHGNEFFKAGNFSDACMAYGEGLKCNPSNPVLYCNRAACFSRLGHWEKSVEDCNEALRIHPSYTKALIRRATSYMKLARWVEAVRDYEVLSKEFPSDTEVEEGLFHARVALKKGRGDEVSNMKFGGEVEKITCLDKLQEAIGLPGVSVVYFMAASNQQCVQVSSLVDAHCVRYPSLNFFKVEINESPALAKSENVRIVPTIKIYKNGVKVKEMICPSTHVLEFSLRHYGV